MTMNDSPLLPSAIYTSIVDTNRARLDTSLGQESSSGGDVFTAALALLEEKQHLCE